MDDEVNPAALVSDLTALLNVEELDRDLYRGPRQPDGRGRVFGGQVIAQALVAAARSVEETQTAHSLHAYFMRPGDAELPIIYRVVRDFDGRSFATRRVIALQRGTPILNMAASFQVQEPGLHHQAGGMPDVPSPEGLQSEREFALANGDMIPPDLRRWLSRPQAIDIRPVDPRWKDRTAKRPPVQHNWVRTIAPLGDDPELHRAVLAFISDMTLLGTCTLPHGIDWSNPNLQSASLDHALWLHEDLRVDEWLLFTTDSPWAGHARGFNRGSFYTRDGTLVASVTQEGLIRLRK